MGEGDQALSASEVPMDSKFAIVFHGIENYTLKDEKAFSGLSMLVTDAKGGEIINVADLFSDSSDGDTRAKTPPFYALMLQWVVRWKQVNHTIAKSVFLIKIIPPLKLYQRWILK